MSELKKLTPEEVIMSYLAMAIQELKYIYPSFNPADPHNINTPKRITKMWIEQFRGLGEPNFEFTTFPNEQEFPNWIIKKDIEFSSMCQHHFMPFFGKIHIGYIPQDLICGISKLDRVVNHFSKRPQVQERLGDDILDYLYNNLQTTKIVVVIESLHTCVACRGIESRNSKMITYHSYNNENVEEFLELLK